MILKRSIKNLTGTTLVETLVAISIFAIAVVVATSILVSIVQLEKRTSVQNAIYEDMRAILQQLTNEIQNGTIDYDEYYSVCVIQNACDPGVPTSEAFYGINYGVYGSRFFDPGQRGDEAKAFNPDDLGVECTFENPVTGECDVIYALSSDINTGQNPFLGASGFGPGDASAFCENNRGVCPNVGAGVTVEQLYLLDETGTKKTILSRKMVRDLVGGGADWALGKIVMNGEDFDQNGVVDTFLCGSDYICEDLDIADDLKQLDVFVADKLTFITEHGITLPEKNDLLNSFYTAGGLLSADNQFIPITPLRSNVEDLKFIITPIEDPYKGFGESAMKVHPTVTIILTLGLSDEVKKDYPGEFTPITVQTTVAAGVVGKIISYPPVDDVRSAGDSWIREVFLGAGGGFNTALP